LNCCRGRLISRLSHRWQQLFIVGDSDLLTGFQPNTTANPQGVAALSLRDRIRHARTLTAGRLVLTTSFGLEDQLLTHAIAEGHCVIDIVTLDTGRLFPETYDLWQLTEQRYGIRIQAFTPAPQELEPLVAQMGINGFRESVANRLACCRIRKVQPLDRALAGAAGWVSGLRADQSQARRAVPFVSVDPARHLLQIHPLFDWTRAQVLAAVQQHQVPYNPLHDAGMPSIGCQPCTRALLPGEDERAGRWWWEHDAARECGLHVGPDGRLTRTDGSKDDTE
jgi:phosphoadenosine phosphosulfate reductase